MSNLTKSILIGIVASLVFTPIGGIAIGFVNYHMDKKEES